MPNIRGLVPVDKIKHLRIHLFGSGGMKVVPKAEQMEHNPYKSKEHKHVAAAVSKAACSSLTWSGHLKEEEAVA